jgi:hypothetical protein
MQAGAWIFPPQGTGEVPWLLAGKNQYFQVGDLFNQRQHYGNLREHATRHVCPGGSSKPGGMLGKAPGRQFLEQLLVRLKISPHSGFQTGQQDTLRAELMGKMSE